MPVGLNGAMSKESLPSLLRADLDSARYFVDGLTELWGESAARALDRGQRVPALRELGRHDSVPLATLARLFVLGLPVHAHELAAALPRLGIAGAGDLDLVALHPNNQVHPLVDLRPYSFADNRGAVNWWIASDLGELATGQALREDHVLGIGGASHTLASLMVREPVGSVLDLGTGCGIQAMHASRHGHRVVATDISQRALRFARLNAALNGINNIEFRLGSLFEPVAAERFDQIVANPPFVITPRVEGVPAYEYRDGGRVGDALVAEVVAGVSDHLVPGGLAQLLGNWEYREASDRIDAFDRIDDWLQGSGLDVWVVEREVQDAALYAETWIRDGGTRHGEQFDELADAWLDDFEKRGVPRVGFGYLTLRRPHSGGPRLHRMERIDGPLPATLGAHISATVAAHDWQASVDDDALRRARMTVAADVTEERHYWPGDEHPAAITLRQGGGFGRSFPLGTALAAVVGASDGELSVGAICAAIAQLLEVDEAELIDEVLPGIRELVVTGFLLPAA